MPKKRLDVRLLELLPQYSRAQIQSWIMQGKIKIDGTVVSKPGQAVSEGAVITHDISEPKYVGRAGFKLEKMLDESGIDVKDFVVLDAGLSTGGFTDCLLQRGAAKIYGIDVGYGQAHEKIRADSRVIVMERVNLRELEALPELVDLVTLDLSFISVLKVMDAVTRQIKDAGSLIVLIKPQFESEKYEVGKGGIVRDPEVHARVVKTVCAGIVAHGFELCKLIESPIEGTMGNKEFLAYFTKKHRQS